MKLCSTPSARSFDGAAEAAPGGHGYEGRSDWRDVTDVKLRPLRVFVGRADLVHRRSIIGLLLFAAKFGVCAQTLLFEFVSLDDPSYVIFNSEVRGGLTLDSAFWTLMTLALRWPAEALDDTVGLTG
jgi:hypothetical protein